MEENLLQRINNNLEELIRLQKRNQNVFNAYEAADYLRISYWSLLRYTRIGEIEHVPNGTSYLYKKDFLDKWLERRRGFKNV